MTDNKHFKSWAYGITMTITFWAEQSLSLSTPYLLNVRRWINCYLRQTNWLWSGLSYILVHFYKYMELLFNKLKNISPSNVHMFLEVYDTLGFPISNVSIPPSPRQSLHERRIKGRYPFPCNHAPIFVRLTTVFHRV